MIFLAIQNVDIILCQIDMNTTVYGSLLSLYRPVKVARMWIYYQTMLFTSIYIILRGKTHYHCQWKNSLSTLA
jgi:hypothetical protein